MPIGINAELAKSAAAPTEARSIIFIGIPLPLSAARPAPLRTPQ
jgi:hypothetical protein